LNVGLQLKDTKKPVAKSGQGKKSRNQTGAVAVESRYGMIRTPYNFCLPPLANPGYYAYI